MTSVGGLCIAEILHKAFIKVDEEGSEAAATALVVMVIGASQKTYEFVANHPFTYMLIEADSKAIVLVGRYVGN